LRPGYDLWELVVGDAFHAANLRRRALARAARLASEVGDLAAARYAVASELASLALTRFHSPVRAGFVNVLEPRPPWFGLVSRLDMGVVGSGLLAFDPADDDADVHRPAIRDTFELLRSWASEQGGRGIGRFPEDGNDGVGSTGGNPWTVTTLWAAQQLLRDGRYDAGYGFLLDALAGDAALLGEQLDAATGDALGATPLAWAHAELVVTLLDPTLSASSGPCG
jgi:GH15 family glucan-1,4-alpha-glucosidase